MMPTTNDRILNFTYEKTSAEIIEAVKKKSLVLRAKANEREGRLSKVRTEYGITDAILVELLQQAREQTRVATSYTVSNAKMLSADRDGGNKMTEETITIGAGVVNMLMTEQDHMTAERSSADKLDMIARNLIDLPNAQGKVVGHRLTLDELKYLGF